MAKRAKAADGFLHINGLRIHYLDWGNPEAPTVILVHGLRSFAHGWDGVAEDLCDRYRVLGLDQRGRGDSDWDPQGGYHTEAYVSDLEAFTAQLGLARFIMVGHSMGGANTIVYASRHPDRITAAVIEDIGPRADPPAPGFARITTELERTPESFASWEEAERFVRGERTDIPDEALQRRLENSLKPGPHGRLIWKYDLAGIRKTRELAGDVASQIDLWPHVRGLKCPTLLLRGARSDILMRDTAEAMAAANPKIRLVEVPDAAHFVHEDNLPVFNREVARFLEEHR